MSDFEMEMAEYANSAKQIVIWLDHTGKKSSNGDPVYILRSHTPFDHLSSIEYRNASLDNDPYGNILEGYKFCATMQLRTPNRILKQHGRIYKKGFHKLPKILTEEWQGVWLPEMKTFSSLGLDCNEIPLGTMASEVGQIPSDGGDFLRFILFSQQILREEITHEQKVKWFSIAYNMIGQDGVPLKEFMDVYGSDIGQMSARILYLSRNS